MNACKCFQLLIVVSVAILGLTGASLVLYAAAQSHLVDLHSAEADGMGTILNAFIRCDQKATNTTGMDTGGLFALQVADCAGQHLSVLIVCSFAGVFSLLAMISAIGSNCKDIKGNQYCYSVISGVSMSLLVAGMAIMAADVWPAARVLAPCDSLGLTDVEKSFAASSGVVCIDGALENPTAIRWLGHVAMFYAGSGISIFCLMVFMLLNACCGDDKSATREERVPLNPNQRQY